MLRFCPSLLDRIAFSGFAFAAFGFAARDFAARDFAARDFGTAFARRLLIALRFDGVLAMVPQLTV